MGIEPTSSAWKAEVIAIIRHPPNPIRPAALRATFKPPCGLIEPFIGSNPPRYRPVRHPRMHNFCIRFKILQWWRGEDYSRPSVFRPPGRRTSCDVQAAMRPSRTSYRFKPSPVQTGEAPAHAQLLHTLHLTMVEGGGFEPPKAEPADLQSAPFGHSGTPPKS